VFSSTVTPVLSRILKHIIVREFLYPAITSSLVTLDFSNQFAFRPTGSTAAALVAILQSATDLLSTNPYVIIMALDFSKAFDTLHHATLLKKVAL